MTAKLVKSLLAAVLGVFAISGLLLTSNGSVAAQGATSTPATVTGGDDPIVIIEITGVVAAVTPDQITFTDGTTVRIVGVAIPPEVQPGVLVRITATFDGDNLILTGVIIVLGTPTPTATFGVTLTPTMTATAFPTAEVTVEPTSEATFEAACPEALNDHPVGHRLADAFGVSYEEIMSWKCAGFGFGEITHAYTLSASTGVPVADIFAMKSGGMGWGNIRKQLTGRDDDDPTTVQININPGKGHGKGADHDNGKGNGKDKGNGNGKGNGKGPKK
ncbi:MAG: hypothetical protein U0528_09525 [Anaerolineae bacterium]